jgi:hypothetical protein
MLTSLASIQLESDSRRFGNPNRFIPVGKCSSIVELGGPAQVSDLPRIANRASQDFVVLNAVDQHGRWGIAKARG